MDALISGRAGLALLVDDGYLASIHASAPEEVVTRSPSDIPFLFGPDRGFRLVENISREQASRQLIEDRRFEEALHLVLLVLDGEADSAIRQQAAGELEELLGEPTVPARLTGLLYSAPLPPAADLVGALLASATKAFTRELLRGLFGHRGRGNEQARRQMTEVAEPADAYGEEEDPIERE